MLGYLRMIWRRGRRMSRVFFTCLFSRHPMVPRVKPSLVVEDRGVIWICNDNILLTTDEGTCARMRGGAG